MRPAFVCFFLFTSFYCAAQYYETYSPANGLVDARVTRILQDGSGRMYFLTRDGLSIYDGQRFVNHTRLGNLPIGIVNDGMLLPDGTLRLLTFEGSWISTGKKGIAIDSLYLPKIPEASAILTFDNNEKLIVSNHGLFLNPNNSLKGPMLTRPNASRPYPFDKTIVTGTQLVFTYYEHKSHSIYLWDKNTNTVTDSLVMPFVHSFAVDKKGIVYICSATGILQLNKVALENQKLQVEPSWLQSRIPDDFHVNHLFIDRQDNIWLISESQGCRKLDPRSGHTQYFSAANGLLTGITGMFQDRENNYWFITYGKGVQKLVQTNYEIVTSIGNEPLTNVYSASTAHDQTLFLSIDEKMLAYKQGRTGIFPLEKFLLPGPFFFWKNSYWNYVSPDRIMNNNRETISLGDSSAVSTITHFPSSHTSVDQQGNLLLAGNVFTLLRPDGNSRRRALPYFADVVVADKKNDYWAFCRSNDIVKFSWENGELVKKSSFVQTGLEPRYVIHWNLDTFWIASRVNGILIVKVNERSCEVISRLNRNNGLSNDFIETLLKIGNDQVAAGTASGLDIITLTAVDTLVRNVSARINHFEPILQLGKDDKGIVYARTENQQLFRYDPYTASSPGYEPDAWFNTITVNDIPVDSGTSRFNYLKNNFFFSVSTPSFTDSRSILFRFTLRGENRSWEQNSNKADFPISNLSPGNYVLNVLIRYPGRIYPDKQLNYHFTILPPFWKTWWFLSGLILLIFLTGWYVVRSYLGKQLQRQKMIMEKELAIEQERNRMARELHDGLGSMLSGIKHSFSAMKNRLSLAEQEELVFHNNIDKLNESILELRNISHSMASESLLKYGLENSLKDYCQNLSHQGQPSISFNALGTSGMKLNEEQSFHIFRIVQELLQNCIKHAGASQIILQLSFNQRRLYITVEDDGKGFDLNYDIDKGMGLKNIETRVKILKGKMDYQTAPQKGTSVLIEIPCEEKD